MKGLKNILTACFIVLWVTGGIAQSKKSAQEGDIRNKIQNKNYTFMADYMIPQRGGSKQLTAEYDLRVKSDSVVAFLPYYGQAYFDVPYNPTEGGVKFTSTHNDYKVTNRKKGGWTIEIDPKDVKNTRKLILEVSAAGYASLSILSNNRDQISFNGYIK